MWKMYFVMLIGSMCVSGSVSAITVDFVYHSVTARDEYDFEDISSMDLVDFDKQVTISSCTARMTVHHVPDSADFFYDAVCGASRISGAYANSHYWQVFSVDRDTTLSFHASGYSSVGSPGRLRLVGPSGAEIFDWQPDLWGGTEDFPVVFEETVFLPIGSYTVTVDCSADSSNVVFSSTNFKAWLGEASTLELVDGGGATIENTEDYSLRKLVGGSPYYPSGPAFPLEPANDDTLTAVIDHFGIAVGDSFVVEKIIYEGFDWRISVDNGTFDPVTSQLSYQTLEAGENVVNLDHTTVILDLVVSVELPPVL